LADPRHLALLKQGPAIWNGWRGSEPDAIPDLREANLVRAELSGADLRRARLDRAKLIRAKLKAADLSEAILEDATLIEADLTEAKLVAARLGRANLANAVLRKARLVRGDFQQCILTVADLRESDCREADFRRADLRETAFREANLTGVRLDEALLHGTLLEGADLSSARGLTSDQIKVATVDPRTRLPVERLDSSQQPEDVESVRRHLSALRSRLSEGKVARVAEPEVLEFHRLLARLESLGHQVARFRVPDEAFSTGVSSWEYTSGGAAFEMDEARSIESSALASRLDAVLAHLEK